MTENTMKIWLILLVLSECLGELVASAAAQAKENRIHEEEVENDGISHRNHRNMQKSSVPNPVNSQYNQQHHHHQFMQEEKAGFRPFNIYPWTRNTREDGYIERNEELIEKMRHIASLEVNERIIPKALLASENSKMNLRNSEGQEWIAYVKDTPTTPRPIEHTPNQVDFSNEQVLSSKFEGLCIYFIRPKQTYWYYEWCHRKDIHQFHTEPDPRNKLTHSIDYLLTNGVRTPDWSLGSYASTRVVREKEDDSTAKITEIIDTFSGGQICDENNQKRSTEVHIQCCNEPINSGEKQRNNMDVVAYIRDIDEPSLCTYNMTVCSPLMCDQVIDRTHQSQMVSPRVSNSLTSILHALNNSCAMRLEGWWTYELCIGSHIRQMHLHTESTKLEDGYMVQSQIIQSQYSLGFAPRALYDNETALTQLLTHTTQQANNSRLDVFNAVGMPSSLLLGQSKNPGSLLLEFTNGTPCDVGTNTSRSTTVELSCGESLAFVDISEDYTCHYYVKMKAVEACYHHSLVPRTIKSKIIEFYPLEERIPIPQRATE